MRTLLLLAVLAVAANAADPAASFTGKLTPAQKTRLGLDALSPVQLAELDEAIEAYLHGEKAAAVGEAVAQTQRQAEEKVKQAEKKAAESAVAEYKKKEEPGVIARTLERFKSRQEEEHREQFVGRLVGEFRGWSGGTYFPLADGQVWRQMGSEVFEMPPVKDAELLFYKSSNGYWRMKYAGAWITVKRLQ